MVRYQESLHEHSCAQSLRNGLYSIRQIRKYLSEDATKVLVHAFVTSPPSSRLLQLPALWHSKIPTWSLAADSTRSCTHCLPVIQVQSHQTIVLCNRLPVPYRIQFKNLLLVHRAIFGVAPVYLKKFLSFKESASYNLLRSNTTYELKVPKTKCKTFGDRVFARVGPPLWNILRSGIRSFRGSKVDPLYFVLHLPNEPILVQWLRCCTFTFSKCNVC